jgi:2-keto-4-pentenoate hydratase
MFAEKLIDLDENPRLLPPFTDRHPDLTAAQGYQAAAALHRRRLDAGWRPVGRKIGFTNRTIWPRYGVYEPIWGTVYDRTLIRAEGNRATVTLQGLSQPRIEPEICFGLKSAPPSSDADAVLRSIEWVAHSIELVQCHHPDWKFRLPDTTAANGLHGRLVLGTCIPIGDLSGLAEALPRVKVLLRKDDAVVDEGTGRNVLGSPLLALAHLVSVLAVQPDASALRAGELVSSGTLTDAHPVKPGETWSTELSGLPLPGLTVRFE